MSAKTNSQRVFILVIVGLFFITSAATTIFVVYDAATRDDSQPQTSSSQADLQKQIEALQQQQGGNVESTDIVVGTGTEATAGKAVTVNYKGTLTDGTEFDNSYSRNEPFTFNLGGGQVIQGWDQGVAGMKVGGKRKLVIPPELAYGDQSPSPKIPANSTLVFEIELLDVK